MVDVNQRQIQRVSQTLPYPGTPEIYAGETIRLYCWKPIGSEASYLLSRVSLVPYSLQLLSYNNISIVYDPRAKDNEKKSAELFVEFSKEVTIHVRQLIMLYNNIIIPYLGCQSWWGGGYDNVDRDSHHTWAQWCHQVQSGTSTGTGMWVLWASTVCYGQWVIICNYYSKLTAHCNVVMYNILFLCIALGHVTNMWC